MKTTRDDNAKPTTDGSCIRLRNAILLLKIFLSGMSVDVFLITENLRNTAVKHIEPYQATLGSGVKRRERERERERERD